MTDVLERMQQCTGMASDFYEDEMLEGISEIKHLRARIAAIEKSIERCHAIHGIDSACSMD